MGWLRPGRTRRVAGVLLVVVVLVGLSVPALLTNYAATFSSAAAAQLQTTLIQATGLLLAFTGIIFTGMLAEVRSQSERATLSSNASRVEELRRTSTVLRICAFGGFLMFTSALVYSLGMYAWMLGSQAPTSISDAAVLVPQGATILGGMAFLIVALGEVAFA